MKRETLFLVKPETNLAAEMQLADFDRLVQRVRAAVEGAPDWEPFDRATALWQRLQPRLAQLQLDLDRVLVVGIVGGTGTGKSTLLNALVGQRVCAAGDVQRPTTNRPMVLAGPEVPLEFVPIDELQAEEKRLNSPLVAQMVLIDCPDPDTQASDDANSIGINRNRDRLRHILPHCDVLLVTGTAQKYKTQAVLAELLHHAAGRQMVFIQTHAATDADITADWRKQLQAQGFEVPRIFRIDSEAALVRGEQLQPLPTEFAQLIEFLRQELAERGSRRILRANALDLLSNFLQKIESDVVASLPKLEQLEAELATQRQRLFSQIQNRLQTELDGQQGVWRARLLREVTLRWSFGPLAAFLRVLNSVPSLLRFLPLMRARSATAMLVAGGFGAGKAVVESVRESLAENRWLAAAELGLAPGDLSQSRSVLDGYTREAGLTVAATVAAPLRDARVEESLVATARQLYTQVDADLTAALSARAARKAGGVLHFLLEVLFAALPLALLALLAKNFFYDNLYWSFAHDAGRPLLGIEFLVQSALWIVLWGLLLRGFLAWRLQRGWQREVRGILERLSPETTLGPLFDEYETAIAECRAAGNRLKLLRDDSNRLRGDLEHGNSWQLSRLRLSTASTGST